MKYKNFSNNLKMYRKKLGLTQKELGKKILKSEISIRKYENGNTNVPPSTLIDLCRALNVSDKDLLGDDFELYISENIDKILKRSDDINDRVNALSNSLISAIPTHTLDFKQLLYDYIEFNYESNFDIFTKEDKLTESELHYLYKKTIDYIDLLTEQMKRKKQLYNIEQSLKK